MLSNFFKSKPKSPAFEFEARPMSLNKTYPGMPEFIGYRDWGAAPDHNNANEGYIPIAGRKDPDFNYPTHLQWLIKHGWQTAAKPGNGLARGNSGVLSGSHRVTGGQVDLTQNEAPSRLRRGFGRTADAATALYGGYNHMEKFKVVAAFTFRGDTRRAEDIKAAGGFIPPSMRTDDTYRATIAEAFYKYMQRTQGLTISDPQEMAEWIQGVIRFMNQTFTPENRKLFAEYTFWRQVLDGDSMHLRGMTNNSFLKAYISTTRDIMKALGASSGTLGGSGAVTTSGNWVYVCRIKAGFLLKAGVGGVSKTEAEVAHLGPLAWKNVYGFVNLSLGADKTIYLRNDFETKDPVAFKQVLGSLSQVSTM